MMGSKTAIRMNTLVAMATAQVGGIRIADVRERFGVSHRTAQRLLRDLESDFGALTWVDDGERCRRWRVPRDTAVRLPQVTPEDLSALGLAVDALRQTAASGEAERLAHLRDRLQSGLEGARAARVAADYDALLEAQGLVARPGPRQQADPDVSAAILESIKACAVLKIRYHSHRLRNAGQGPEWRWVAPYGIVTGIRRYLVALDTRKPDGRFRQFRVQDILEATVTRDAFVRDPDFDLRRYAARSFGVYKEEAQYGEVVWRFSPAIADRAREFEFHPDQTMETGADGSLVVRFHAAGWEEMCWYLYAWGDKVEVLAPEGLRAMVHPWRRGDFRSTP